VTINYKDQRNCLFLVTIGILLSYLMPVSTNAQQFQIDPNTDKIYLVNSDNKSISVIDGKSNKLVTNIPVIGEHKTTVDPNTLASWAAVGATIGAIVTAGIGLSTYRQGQVLKKKDIQKDIVFPLISEFDNSKDMDYAKKILDDHYFEHPPGGPHGLYTLNRLLSTLRDHTKPGGKWDEGDGEIRDSFDSLLDFFSKLEYLRALKLLEDREMDYFRYYIDKAAENEAVVSYAETYKFPLHFESLRSGEHDGVTSQRTWHGIRENVLSKGAPFPQ
jgi:YVTN family beta-propeller protein